MRRVRRTAALVVAAVALGAAVWTGSARRDALRLDAVHVTPGADAGAMDVPSSAAPFTPFRVAVVGPVRGDAAAASRALARIERDAPDVDLVVLLGDLTDVGDEREVRALRAAWLDATRPVVAVPSRHDLEPARADVVQAWLGPPRCAFVRHEQRFVGLSGDTSPDVARRFLHDARADRTDGPDALPLLVFTTDGVAVDAPGASLVLDGDDLAQADGLGVELVSMAVDGVASRERWTVARGVWWTGSVRGFSANVLGPLAADDLAFGAVLFLCALLLTSATWLWRARREAVAQVAGRPEHAALGSVS